MCQLLPPARLPAQVSFVNAICTSKGGTHVNYISDQVGPGCSPHTLLKPTGCPAFPASLTLRSPPALPLHCRWLNTCVT